MGACARADAPRGRRTSALLIEQSLLLSAMGRHGAAQLTARVALEHAGEHMRECAQIFAEVCANAGCPAMALAALNTALSAVSVSKHQSAMKAARRPLKEQHQSARGAPPKRAASAPANIAMEVRTGAAVALSPEDAADVRVLRAREAATASVLGPAFRLVAKLLKDLGWTGEAGLAERCKQVFFTEPPVPSGLAVPAGGHAEAGEEADDGGAADDAVSARAIAPALDFVLREVLEDATLLAKHRSKGPRIAAEGSGALWFALGQAAERMSDADLALEFYDKCTDDTPCGLRGRVKRCTLLADKGSVAEMVNAVYMLSKVKVATKGCRPRASPCAAAAAPLTPPRRPGGCASRSAAHGDGAGHRQGGDAPDGGGGGTAGLPGFAVRHAAARAGKAAHLGV